MPGNITAVLARISDETLMRRFCEEILTPAERRTLGLRWRLLEMLSEGVPQRTIAASLGVSLCKITRGSRILKRKDSAVRRILAPRSAARVPAKHQPTSHIIRKEDA
jgi:TrpR family transcriptional regulator, trp operon repressor